MAANERLYTSVTYTTEPNLKTLRCFRKSEKSEHQLVEDIALVIEKPEDPGSNKMT